jgi:transposase
VIPPANTHPVRVFSQDESRFGRLIIRRRRLTARGVQPVGPVQHVFEWCYVYDAVEPTTGARFFLELPYLNAEMFQLFVNAFTQAFPDSLNILLLDNSGAHTSSQLTLPENVRCVFLPPYCPELNPIERVWRDLKDALAWLHFPNLEAQQDYLATLLRPMRRPRCKPSRATPTWLRRSMHSAHSEVILELCSNVGRQLWALYPSAMRQEEKRRVSTK